MGAELWPVLPVDSVAGGGQGGPGQGLVNRWCSEGFGAGAGGEEENDSSGADRARQRDQARREQARSGVGSRAVQTGDGGRFGAGGRIWRRIGTDVIRRPDKHYREAQHASGLFRRS